MILADTNVMVDCFRSRESELAKKIDSMQVALCGTAAACFLTPCVPTESTFQLLTR